MAQKSLEIGLSPRIGTRIGVVKYRDFERHVTKYATPSELVRIAVTEYLDRLDAEDMARTAAQPVSGRIVS